MYFLPSRRHIVLFFLLFTHLDSYVLAQTSTDYKLINSRSEDSLIKLINTAPTDSSKLDLYFVLLGKVLVTRPENFELWYPEVKKFTEEIKSEEGLFKLNVSRLISWNKTGQYLKTLRYAPTLEKSINNTKKGKVKIALYLEWAAASWRVGDFTLSSKLYRKAIEMSREYKLPDLEILTLNNFSAMYSDQGRIDEKRALLKRAIELAQQHSFRSEEMMAKYNLGQVESDLGNYGESIEIIKESLKVFDSLNNKYGVGLCHSSLGFLFLKTRNFDKSLQSLRSALDIRFQMNDFTGYARVRLTMAQVYLETSVVDSGTIAVDEAIKAFDSLRSASDLKEAYRIKAELFARKNDFVNAYKALQQHGIWKDTVYKQSADKQLQQQMLIVKANYTDSLTLAKQAEVTSAKSFRNLLAIATMLLLLISIALYVRSRKKNPATTELHKASERIRALETELQTVKTQLDQQVKFQWSELQGRLAKEGDWSESYWNEFLLVFSRTYPDFFAKLKEQFPDLSQHELRICALVKLNLTQQDMVDILNISVESVRKARYRIYKKMGLGSDQELVDSLLKY